MDWSLVLGLDPRFVGLLKVVRRIRGMGVRMGMGRDRMGMTSY
jgi:hypothetical protein